MPRREKGLVDRVAERSFEPRRHRRLLDGPLAAEPELRALQTLYQRAGSESEKRRLAHDFREVLVGMPAPSLLERVATMDFPTFTRELLGFTLADFQREFSDEFSRLHGDGRRVYRLALLLVPRGAGKTMLSSAIALFELLRRTDDPSVLLAASTKDQGDLAFQYIKRWVRANADLQAAVTVTKHDLVVKDTGGRLRVLSSLGDAAYGETPSVVVCDELHVWRTDSHRTLWEALVSGLGKRPDSLLIGITTVPDSSESLLSGLLEHELAKAMLEQRHDCLRVVRDEDGAVLTWLIGAPDECDLDDEDVWLACNPQPWKTKHELRFERGMLSDSAFSRLILNRPMVDSADALVDRAGWDACKDDVELEEGAEIVVGLEGHYKQETVAVAWCARGEDGRAVCRGTLVDDHDQLAHALEDLAGRFSVQRVAFDPGPLRFAQIGAGFEIEHVAAGSTAAREANRSLYAAIMGGRIAHNGDSVLAEHVCGVRGTWDAHGRLEVYRRAQSDAGLWYALSLAHAGLPDPDDQILTAEDLASVGWFGPAHEPAIVDLTGQMSDASAAMVVTLPTLGMPKP